MFGMNGAPVLKGCPWRRSQTTHTRLVRRLRPHPAATNCDQEGGQIHAPPPVRRSHMRHIRWERPQPRALSWRRWGRGFGEGRGLGAGLAPAGPELASVRQARQGLAPALSSWVVAAGESLRAERRRPLAPALRWPCQARRGRAAAPR